MTTIQVNCPACNGTGLYHGFMERDGEFVICARCGGSGMAEINYTPFTGRVARKGVKKIRAGSGLIIDDTENVKWISYEEFKRTVK